MRIFLASAVVCLIAILPAAAQAGDKLMVVDLPDVPGAPSVLSGEALTIGAGIAIGAAAGYALQIPAATLMGGVAGGLVSHWWYNRVPDHYQPLLRRDHL